MPYQVLQVSRIPKKELEHPLYDVTKHKRHNIAKKLARPAAKLTLKQRQCNEMAYLRYAETLQDFLVSNYWFMRSKIENPATRVGDKRAYRKMCRIYESYLGPDWIKDAPYCTKTRSVAAKAHAHAFCYVKGRIS